MGGSRTTCTNPGPAGSISIGVGEFLAKWTDARAADEIVRVLGDDPSPRAREIRTACSEERDPARLLPRELRGLLAAHREVRARSCTD